MFDYLVRFWLYHRDYSRMSTKIYEFWCWNSPWWWSYEHICLPINRYCPSCPASTIVGSSYSSQDRPTNILNSLLHCRDCHHALMLTCQNSPWWWSCEHTINFLVSFWLLDLNNMVVTSCALIGMRCRLTTYVIWAACEQGLNMSWWIMSLPR